MSHPLLQIPSHEPAGIREPSVSSRCWCDCLKVSVWISRHLWAVGVLMLVWAVRWPASIREPSVSREVCSWHRWNYKPSVSHEPAGIREVCSRHRWNYKPSVRCPCLLDAGVIVWRCPCGSAGIREVCSWYWWNYEPSVWMVILVAHGIVFKPWNVRFF